MPSFSLHKLPGFSFFSTLLIGKQNHKIDKCQQGKNNVERIIHFYVVLARTRLEFTKFATKSCFFT